MYLNSKQIQKILLSLPSSFKRLIIVISDGFFAFVSVWLAFNLRFENLLPISEFIFKAALVSMVSLVIIFSACGIYKEILRFFYWPAFSKLFRAFSLYFLLFFSVISLFGMDGVPRTIGLIQPTILFSFVFGSRYLIRLVLRYDDRKVFINKKSNKILIYGAGEAGTKLAHSITQNERQKLIGFLDDDPGLRGRKVHGNFVFSPNDAPHIINQRGVNYIFLAMPSVNRFQRNKILAQLSKLPVAVRTLPSLREIVTGDFLYTDIRDLEIEDLLGREPVCPNEELIKSNIENKIVLVTGAGGSIGSELCRQILESKPKTLILVENSEFSLYSIQLELQGVAERHSVEVKSFLASVQDTSAINRIMSEWMPQTVYHAAAYKHVPLVEENWIEGVKNNIFGTLVCARAAIEHHTNKFVLVSTDKAVRPTNIMGASKRFSELILQALSIEQSGTCLTMVRFGNVLGSSGSVVPKFRQQIAEGGPISITDYRVTRFFMTTPEAAQLVIQAGSMASGGEVFVLDMGEPVKIYELARKMVELSGLTIKNKDNPTGDIELKEIGLRPGEKLYEELIIGNDLQQTLHPRISKAEEEAFTWSEITDALNQLQDLLAQNDEKGLKIFMSKYVSGYQSSSF